MPISNYQATELTRMALDAAGLKNVCILAMGCLTRVIYIGHHCQSWHAETQTLCEAMEGVQDETDFLKRMNASHFIPASGGVGSF